MKRIFGIVAALAIMAFVGVYIAHVVSAEAQTSYIPPGNAQRLEYAATPATALTSSVSSAWMGVGGFNNITSYVTFVDADSSITRLDMVIQGSNSSTGSPAYNIKAVEIANGIVTVYPTQGGQSTENTPWRYAITGGETYAFPVTTYGFRYIRFTWSVGTGSAGGSDTLAAGYTAW